MNDYFAGRWDVAKFKKGQNVVKKKHLKSVSSPSFFSFFIIYRPVQNKVSKTYALCDIHFICPVPYNLWSNYADRFPTLPRNSGPT